MGKMIYRNVIGAPGDGEEIILNGVIATDEINGIITICILYSDICIAGMATKGWRNILYNLVRKSKSIKLSGE